MRHLSELIELLQTSDTEHRREATFDFLLNIGSESVVNQEDSMLMLTLLKDPDDSVRLNAINIFKILSEEKGNRDILSEIGVPPRSPINVPSGYFVNSSYLATSSATV